MQVPSNSTALSVGNRRIPPDSISPSSPLHLKALVTNNFSRPSYTTIKDSTATILRLDVPPGAATPCTKEQLRIEVYPQLFITARNAVWD